MSYSLVLNNLYCTIEYYLDTFKVSLYFCVLLVGVDITKNEADIQNSFHITYRKLPLKGLDN